MNVTVPLIDPTKFLYLPLKEYFSFSVAWGTIFIGLHYFGASYFHIPVHILSYIRLCVSALFIMSFSFFVMNFISYIKYKILKKINEKDKGRQIRNYIR